jgi:hypothetical protein
MSFISSCFFVSFVCFCLCSAFLSLSFHRVFTGLINLLNKELADISSLPTQIQFTITTSAAPALQLANISSRSSETAYVVLC